MFINNYQIDIKKSKFIAYYYQVNNIEEVNSILNNMKKEHKNAKHIPYAYKIGNIIKKSDDKEPSGTAGLQLYNLINLYDMDNTLLLVVRYYGGIKLGAGLLLRTYKNAGNECIKRSI